MSARAEQMKWALYLQSRELAPGSLVFDDPERWEDVCVDSAIQAFSRDITHGSVEERLVAAEVLAWTLDPRSTHPLMHALADPEPQVRRAAAQAFSSYRSGPDWTVAPLLQAVYDMDANVRYYAVGALSVHRARSDVCRVLSAALKDPVELVQRHASIVLRGM